MSKHRTVLALVAAACVSAGCASSSQEAPVAEVNPRQATIFSGSESITMYSDAARASQQTFQADPAKVMAAVRQTFADYSIPVTIDNATTRQIGNDDFFRTRQFMGRPMQTLLSCGSSMTGPNAATFRIFMSLLVQVAPDAEGKTTAGVTFIASARDMSGGTSADRLPCGNLGIVDQLFLERVAANLNK